MAKTLIEYQLDLNDKDCQWCRKTHTKETVLLKGLQIEHYDHDHGYSVEGYKWPQWLYVTCPKCNYQWSFKKLRIPV